MKDNMFQPSCGHHQVSQVEIKSHMRIMHLYGIPLVLQLIYVFHDLLMLINICTVVLTFILW